MDELTKPIYLSASSLDRWLNDGCPARWHYEQDWETKKKESYFELGLKVHRMMEGRPRDGDSDDPNAARMYDKIRNLVSSSGLALINPPEIHQQFEIMPGVIWTRVIDRLAFTPDGRLVALDWKTGGGWKQIEGTMIVPATLGPQSMGYLYPPPPEMPVEQWITKPEWPKSMYYIVAGYRGPAEFLPYEYNEEDEGNFFRLVAHVRDSIISASQILWPKAYGKRCLECPMNQMCYNVKGHKKLYVKKTHDRRHVENHGTKNRKAVRPPTG